MPNRRDDRDTYYEAEDRASYLDRVDYADELDRGRYRPLERPAGGPARRYGEEARDAWLDQERREPERYVYGDPREPGRFAGRGPRNYRRSDARIFEDVCERLTMHGDVDASDVEVRVENGEVALEGTVDSRQARRLAEETASSVDGVVDVRNNLRVAQPAARPRASYAAPGASERVRAPHVMHETREEEVAPVGATVTDIPPVQVPREMTAGRRDEPDSVVTAIFKTRAAAEAAVERLVESGFRRGDIGLLMSQQTGGREFGFTESSKAPEGAATGAAVGGVLGAIAAGLAAVGTIAIPGLGLVAAGPILAALAGAGAGGAAGSLIGALAGSGIPEHEAKFYSDALEAGSILVSVQAHDDRTEAAEQLLRGAGGESVVSRSI